VAYFYGAPVICAPAVVRQISQVSHKFNLDVLE